jgi:hypothetical protein
MIETTYRVPAHKITKDLRLLRRRSDLKTLSKRYRSGEEISPLEIALAIRDVSNEAAMKAFGKSENWIRQHRYVLEFSEETQHMLGPWHDKQRRLNMSDIGDIRRQRPQDRVAWARDFFSARARKKGATTWVGLQTDAVVPLPTPRPHSARPRFNSQRLGNRTVART